MLDKNIVVCEMCSDLCKNVNFDNIKELLEDIVVEDKDFKGTMDWDDKDKKKELGGMSIPLHRKDPVRLEIERNKEYDENIVSIESSFIGIKYDILTRTDYITFNVAIFTNKSEYPLCSRCFNEGLRVPNYVNDTTIVKDGKLL